MDSYLLYFSPGVFFLQLGTCFLVIAFSHGSRTNGAFDVPSHMVFIEKHKNRYRPGEATETNSCQNVRPIPNEMRQADNIALDTFYKKYTEAYGIPIVASNIVADDALRRCCYELRFLLAGNSAVRKQVYKEYGHFAVIDKSEQITIIPEYAHLDYNTYKEKRGLYYNLVSTAGAENSLCQSDDFHAYEDIVLHECAHLIDLIGAVNILPGFQTRIKAAYDNAMQKGLWNNTYSSFNRDEYFASGAQIYFNVRRHLSKPDGLHGPISTRDRLRAYDPDLYNLIWEVFPCDNPYIERCQATREKEYSQILMMNCNEGGHKHSLCHLNKKDDYCQTHNDYMKENCPNVCSGGPEIANKHSSCQKWAMQGFCKEKKYSKYMAVNCAESCSNPELTNQYNMCDTWAKDGECTKNPKFMIVQCPAACGRKRNFQFTDDLCEKWAESKQCVDNFSYMSVWCKRACYKRAVSQVSDTFKCRGLERLTKKGKKRFCKTATKALRCEASCTKILYSNKSLSKLKKNCNGRPDCSKLATIVDCPTPRCTLAPPNLLDSISECGKLAEEGKCNQRGLFTTAYCPQSCK